jgi:choline dehydrogenase-like flavoprotein
MSEKFDFVIVGGGTSGPLLAARLSNAPAKPSVLLIEAGGAGLATENRAPYQRFMNAFTLPNLDQGYTTVPQKGLGGREISYQRGKGLGGSTMLNFLVYTRGPQADWDRWAALVDDDEWSWKKAEERFKRFEKFEDLTEDRDRRYVDPKKISHGTSGSLGISQPVLEDDVRITIEAGLELGVSLLLILL